MHLISFKLSLSIACNSYIYYWLYSTHKVTNGKYNIYVANEVNSVAKGP